MDYEITNARDGRLIAELAKMADGPLTRMKGLLGRRSMPAGEAIILRPAASIHTVFMLFALDVIYLDAEDRVVKVVRNLAPFRFSAASRARTVIEMAAGATAEMDLQPGDELVFRLLDQSQHHVSPT